MFSPYRSCTLIHKHKYQFNFSINQNRNKLKEGLFYVIPYLNIKDIILLKQVSKEIRKMIETSSKHGLLENQIDINNEKYDYYRSELKLNQLTFPRLKTIYCSFQLLCSLPSLSFLNLSFKIIGMRLTNKKQYTLFNSIQNRIISIERSEWNNQFTQLTSLTKIDCYFSNECNFIRLKQINKQLKWMLVRCHYPEITLITKSLLKYPQQTIFIFDQANYMKDKDLILFNAYKFIISVEGQNNIQNDNIIRLKELWLPNTTNINIIQSIIKKYYAFKLILSKSSILQTKYNIYDLTCLTELKSLEIHSINCNEIKFPSTLTELKLFSCNIENKENILLPLCKRLIYNEISMKSKFIISKNGFISIKKSNWFIENKDILSFDGIFISDDSIKNIIIKNSQTIEYTEDSEDKIISSSRTNSQIEPNFSIQSYNPLSSIKIPNSINIQYQTISSIIPNILSLENCFQLNNLKISTNIHPNYLKFNSLKQIHFVNCIFDEEIILPKSTSQIIIENSNYIEFKSFNILNMKLIHVNILPLSKYPTTLTSLSLNNTQINKTIKYCPLKTLYLKNLCQYQDLEYLPHSLNYLRCDSCVLSSNLFLNSLHLNKLLFYNVNGIEILSLPTSIQIISLCKCKLLKQLILSKTTHLRKFYFRLCEFLQYPSLPLSCINLNSIEFISASEKQLLNLYN
ncbi:hypothetical protein EDI_338250 [Entamoeba dispar SAW760]|uniref:Uncharacterized protein n=1 Tax=Entamoeba dispar (strain ATCC PRA-260 / SAW760) TaxID=370354 RepID=B0EA85_ENTDS|nr:uncharacterized protein EDI_338250 [Entamoeba dispar SAW760]EDR28572.1 hypothetical protein EDI_338250 [Entamoeba dispar SAW760]|eukprot:EDR28572.1 hypothetical protein EDI_338250 [Entamoeba dispar SAW760]